MINDNSVSLLKAALLVVSGTLFAFAITPPRPPVSQTKAVYKGQPFEYIVRYLAWLGCILVVLSSAAHATLLLLNPPTPTTAPLIPYLCPSSPPSLAPLTTLHPRFLLGLGLLLAGGTFRLWSYHALGDLFTFEVSVSDAHTLVTSGPYAHLRHPSYTGLTALLLGAQLMHFGRGGFVSECGIERARAVWPFVWVWRWGTVFGLASLYRRCNVEDASLRERFGEQWDAYAARVRYRLFPWVF
ncbi:hypothetical protein C8Q77DRAFT_1052528 [Trametes polyzona]|nr:hypothetical protein C8Q77DRAFT_1052528 [Trametes polyzona]